MEAEGVRRAPARASSLGSAVGCCSTAAADAPAPGPRADLAVWNKSDLSPAPAKG